jgi:alpha-glucosidase
MSYAQLNQSIGNFKSVKYENSEYWIEAENAVLRLSCYDNNIIRIRVSYNNLWDNHSYALIQTINDGIKFSLEENHTKMVFSTDSVKLEISKNPIRISFYNKKGQLLVEDDPSFGTSWLGEQMTTYKKLQKNEKFIGLGEKTGPLNRRGESYVNWNTDAYAYGNNTDPLYLSIPFYIGVHSGTQYGIFFDNSHKTYFNFGGSNDRFMSFTSEAGEMNYYLIAGNSVGEIIKNYTFLTGRIEMPPIWSLGFQQCKYSYYPESEVLRIAETFREKNFPLDLMYLDIHYMDGYKVFTWDKQKFPDPKRLTDKLKKKGVRLAVILDPGIKIEQGYPCYEEGKSQNLFIKYPDGTDYAGQVWPGWCHFPDFTNPKTRLWWGQSMKKTYIDNGVEGFWNDMNEIATWGQNLPNLIELDFEGQKASMRKGRNIYGLQMSKSTFEGTKALMNGNRPFVLTRAGYSGVQRYSAVWTGDNVSSDENMMLGIRLMNSMGLSGVPVVGTDIGGFTGGPSPQLFARWMSIGAFSPFSRAHVAIDQKDQEPWSFGKKVEEISRNYIQLRYKLLPYFYSLFHQAHTEGMPIQRSLAIDYTHDDRVYSYAFQNQFTLGKFLLVAPVESYKEYVKVLLPSADWYDFYNDTFYKGNEEIVTEAPLERLPVFVKGGSIIPMQSAVLSTMDMPKDTLYLHVYNGGNTVSNLVYYEDDGLTYEFKKGKFYKRNILLDNKAKKLVFEKVEGSFESKFKNIKVIFHGYDTISNLKVEKQKLSFMKPLPHFDPVGTGAEKEFSNVQTLLIPNKVEKIELNW